MGINVMRKVLRRRVNENQTVLEHFENMIDVLYAGFFFFFF